VNQLSKESKPSKGAMSASIRTMLENVAPADIGADDLSLDEEFEGSWSGLGAATPGNRGSGRDRDRSPLTPTLSLPDSFDGEYGSGNRGNQQMPFNRDAEMKKMRQEVARMKELMQERHGMFRDLVRQQFSGVLFVALPNRHNTLLRTHLTNHPSPPLHFVFTRKFLMLCTSNCVCGLKMT